MKVTEEQVYNVYNSNSIDVSFANSTVGMLDEKQGRMLASVASLCPKDEVIVEIGSFQGKSLSYLTQGANAGECKRVISVDGTAREAELKSNLAQLNILTGVKNEHYYRGGCDVWEELLDDNFKIGVFFYDAEHSIRAFFTNLVMYSHMFADEAVIITHDVHAIETSKVLRAFAIVCNVDLEILFYEPEWYGKTGFLGVQYRKGNRYPLGSKENISKNERLKDTLDLIDHVAITTFHSKAHPDDV